jgi:hypothetical protein
LATKLGTFHWPPNFGSTFTSPLSLKGKLGSWGVLFFPDIIFSSILNTYFDKLLEEEKKMINLDIREK